MVKGQLKFELWVADVHEGKGKLIISDARVKTERRADVAGMVHQRLRTPLQFAHLGFQTPPEPDMAGHIYATCAARSPPPMQKSRPPAQHSVDVPPEGRVDEQHLNDATRPVVI